MPHIPERMHGPALVSNVAATKYTAPAGYTPAAIVRHIHISNPSGAQVTFTFSIGGDAVGTRLFDAFGIAAGTTYDHFCYYVLGNAEILQAFAGTNNVLTLTIDGDRIVPG